MLPAVVITASPTLQPPCLSRIFIHSSRMALPPARCIAPSTPPPPNNDVLAAFTMASTCILVISPEINSIRLSGMIFKQAQGLSVFYLFSYLCPRKQWVKRHYLNTKYLPNTQINLKKVLPVLLVL